MRGLPAAFCFLFLLAIRGAVAQSSSEPDATYVRAHRAVTANAEAQRAFDDGLTLLYAFNPQEARRSFERAAHADPSLAMVWWGIAMSYGVNINTSFDPGEQRAGAAAIAKGRSLAPTATSADRALIAAASARFAYARSGDDDRSARAYRDAMNGVANAFPLDDDVQTLSAEAEMDVHPWSYFTSAGEPTPGTLGIMERLRSVLQRDPAHIGANHYYIHALEESPHPEEALPAARRLAADRFEAAAEHLTHMPAHAFMRTGFYHDAGEANARAVEMLHEYLAQDATNRADYLGHDCAFGVDAFMFSGEYARARSLALTCARGGVGMVPIVDLRFRRWDALDGDGASTDIGAGMAAAHAARYDAALLHLRNLRKSGGDVGELLVGIIEAQLARSRGHADEEIAALERAVAKQDAFGYSEPPAFWFPVRETLGGAFYRARRYADAERTFRADLSRTAENPRSLFGLARTLEAQGRLNEARAVDARFARAWQKADVSLDMKDL